MLATRLVVPDGSPWWMFAGADLILFLHIAGGSLALVSGALALFARKGGRTHRLAGITFCASMAVMASIGAAASPFLPVPERANIIAGILTLYLVWSGWVAVRSKQVVASWQDTAGLFVALLTVTMGALWALEAAQRPNGMLDNTPPQAYYLFMIMGTLAALGDVRLIWRGHLTGAPRLSRHLWRMCVAMFIASGSFFLGQQQVMPGWMRGSPWLFVPTFMPLAVMIYWLVNLYPSANSSVAIKLDVTPGSSLGRQEPGLRETPYD